MSAPLWAAPPASARLPPPKSVQAVVDALRKDPALNGMEHKRTLRWKPPEREKTNVDQSPWLLRLIQWLGNAMSAVAEGSRVFVWLLLAALVAALIVTVRRWVRVGGISVSLSNPPALPSRVGALDVRPETLPARIGAAARDLWLQGQQRAALALLYRGALSRLIHRYAVPIRAAHTESECLGLARQRLAPDPGGFFAELVRVWQLAVYGARHPEGDRVLALCADFDRVLDPPVVSGGAP